MDIRTKLDYLDQHVRSISRHDDEDATIIRAALNQAKANIDAELLALDARLAARVAETLAPRDDA